MMTPYLVDCEDGGLRLAVLAYQHPDGVCYLDVGWPLTSCNPFHVLKGNFTNRGNVWASERGESIRTLTPDNNPNLWQSWENWLDYLESPDGIEVNHQSAIDGCKANGALIDKPL